MSRRRAPWWVFAPLLFLLPLAPIADSPRVVRNGQNFVTHLVAFAGVVFWVGMSLALMVMAPFFAGAAAVIAGVSIYRRLCAFGPHARTTPLDLIGAALMHSFGKPILAIVVVVGLALTAIDHSLMVGLTLLGVPAILIAFTIAGWLNRQLNIKSDEAREFWFSKLVAVFGGAASHWNPDTISMHGEVVSFTYPPDAASRFADLVDLDRRIADVAPLYELGAQDPITLTATLVPVSVDAAAHRAAQAASGGLLAGQAVPAAPVPSQGLVLEEKDLA